MGRQNAAWLLMSSEWVDAAEAQRMGLAWKVCEPDDLLPEARRHAEILASRPISSLIAVKQTIVEPSRGGDRRGDRQRDRALRRATRRSGQRRCAGRVHPEADELATMSSSAPAASSRPAADEIAALLEPIVRQHIPGAADARIANWRATDRGLSTETFLFDLQKERATGQRR